VGGREIWGKTVPLGKWARGAERKHDNCVTDDVSIEGKSWRRGRMAAHAPGQRSVDDHISKNSTSWGSFSYDEKEDALRVSVKRTRRSV